MSDPTALYRQLLAVTAEIETAATAAGAPLTPQLRRALNQVLDLNRTALATAGRATGAGRGEAPELVDRYRRLYAAAPPLDADGSGPETLLPSLIALVTALEADAGALILLDEMGEVDRLVGHQIGAPADRAEVLQVSSTVLARVRAMHGAVQIDDVAADPALAHRLSVVQSHVRAVLCVPIFGPGGDVQGAAYLDRRTGNRPFSRTDLELLTAFARQSGAALRLWARIDGLTTATDALRSRLDGRLDLTDVVGRSPAMTRLLERLAVVADSNRPVLLAGETGVGKNLLARAIHLHSARRDHPFRTISGATAPESLLDGLLLGRPNGEPGLLESTRGGTLLIDEIESLTPALQQKVRLAMTTGTVPGAERPADVRWLAASTKDLAAEVAAGRFDADLYARFQADHLPVPPLRERVADIVGLADGFVRLFGARHGRPARGLSPEALSLLEAHTWPGNVRELENTIHRAVLVADGPRITPADLPTALIDPLPVG